ncbi:LysR substrate-binding domain-containing protein [Variovorax sp. YR752]|uniref:LysR family transcriptional regulator n=1 Tax=Variovorax sp. YR752 TaxID=1884383 RepID=UPI003137AE6A
MDLVQLKYFCKVAELKSFTQAASALHVAQPAITRQIQLLEDELGVQLLFRHSRGAEPTEEGIRLKDGADSIFRLISQTRADVVACSTTATGNLRIGFPPSIGDLLIGSTVAAYRKLHPNVSLSLHEGYSHALRDALLADKLDLAILTGTKPNPLLQTQHLCDEHLWFIEPTDGAPYLKGSTFDFAEIAKRSLVQPGMNNTVRKLLERKAAESGVTLNVDVEAEALHVIKGLVQRGVGSHVSPYSAVSQDIENGQFSGGPIAGLSVARFLARRIDRPSNLALQRFQALIVEQLSGLARLAGGAIVLATSLRATREA